MFHTILYDKASKGEVLLAPVNSTKHVAFPHQSWAYHMINCDPRKNSRVEYRRVEECNCTEVITASEFMKLDHMTRYGQRWENSYSTSGYTSTRTYQPEIKVEWSGERLPVLTRAERAALQQSQEV